MAAVNAWRLWDEHWEHKSHEPPLEEKVEYPYQNIRTKKFFWGDGDKVSCCYYKTTLPHGPNGWACGGCDGPHADVEDVDCFLEHRCQLP